MNEGNAVKLELNILLVDDKKDTLEAQVGFLHAGLGDFYALNIVTRSCVIGGLGQLRRAIVRRKPFHCGIFDYLLPEEEGGPAEYSVELPTFALEHPASCRCVIQMTSFPEDKNLTNFWKGKGYENRVYGKGPDSYLRLLEFLRFKEIRDVLASEALVNHLGVGTGVAARKARTFEGFEDLGTFVRRLEEVWEHLDCVSRERAYRLFKISEDPRGDVTIGFKNFRRRSRVSG